MKLISLPDLHGSLRYITALGPILRQVDLVVLPGDLTISGTSGEAERVISAIRQYNPRILAVPGGYDTQRVNQYLSEQAINLHKQTRDDEGYVFIGLGGDLFQTGAPREHLLYDNVQFDIMLHETIQGLSRRLPKILITHYPPQGTLVDRTRSGQQIGSRIGLHFLDDFRSALRAERFNDCLLYPGLNFFESLGGRPFVQGLKHSLSLVGREIFHDVSNVSWV